jgi:uncharacterized protein (DUF983 family)
MIGEKTPRPGWLQFMRRCPHCGQKWLIFAARESGEQLCKSCGLSFLKLGGDAARRAVIETADETRASASGRVASGGAPPAE